MFLDVQRPERDWDIAAVAVELGVIRQKQQVVSDIANHNGIAERKDLADRHHQKDCNPHWRKDANSSTNEKTEEVDPARALMLYHEQACDEIAAQEEEDRDTEPARDDGSQSSVRNHDDEDSDRPQTIE